MRRSFLAALLVVSALAPQARAQARAEPAKGDLGKSIIDQELEPAPGGYSYNPQGRRDPFISLVKPVGPQGTKGPRPAGIPWALGFLVYLSLFATVPALVLFGRTVGMAISDLSARPGTDGGTGVTLGGLDEYFSELRGQETGGLASELQQAITE